MKISIIDEALDFLRNDFDMVLNDTLRSMIEQNAEKGEIVCKLKIDLKEYVNKDGVVVKVPEMSNSTTSTLKQQIKSSSSMQGDYFIDVDGNGNIFINTLDDGQEVLY